MVRTIAVANQKGGVGKTTTAVNLAHGLALQKKQVLLLDFDNQASATVSLGFKPTPDSHDLLIGRKTLAQVVFAARDNLDLIRSNDDLAAVEPYLASMEIRDPKRAWNQLNLAMQHGLRKYDFVIVDSGPGISVLTINALVFADELLVPISMDFLSEIGTRPIIDAVATLQTDPRIQASRLSAATLRYIVPTFYQTNVKRSESILDRIRNTFTNIVTSYIRHNTQIAEAPEKRKTIFEYAPRSHGAVDYAQLTQEVLHART